MPEGSVQFLNFADSVAWVYERNTKGSKQYPGFFTLHSMSFAAGEKETGRLKMEQYFDHMKTELCRVLKMDQCVNPEAFNDKLTPRSFVDLVFYKYHIITAGREEGLFRSYRNNKTCHLLITCRVLAGKFTD